MAAVTDPTQLRESIRQSFRKACLKRLEGQEADAVKILQEELPMLIKAWKSLPQSETESLEQIFAEELQRTENASWIVGQLENRMGGRFNNLITQAQAEAMQSLASAQLQLGFNAIKERLQSGLSEVITYQGAEALGSRVSQELSERVRTALNGSLEEQTKILNTLPTKQESQAANQSLISAVEISSENLKPAITALANNVEAALDQQSNQLNQLATKQDVAAGQQQLAQQLHTIEQQFQKIDALPAKEDLALLSNTIKPSLEQVKTSVENALNQQSQYLKALPSKDELMLQLDSVRVAAESAVKTAIDKAVDVESLSKLIDSVKDANQDAAARTQSGIASELSAYEARETRRWADRQTAWSRALEGIIKKSDLDASLWQAQNAIGERVETKMRALETLAAGGTAQAEKLIADVKAVLTERLSQVVSAQAFESRLMAMASMIHDAQAKALQEAVTSLQTTVEKRLAESTTPIYQRVTSLLTYTDWERLSKESNERMLGSLREQMTNTLTPYLAAQQSALSELKNAMQASLTAVGGQLDEQLSEVVTQIKAHDTEMNAMLTEQSQAAVLRIQDLRGSIEQQAKLAQGATAQALSSLNEKLATLIIEATEQQKTQLGVFQKEMIGQQTQSLGMLSVQQQNFLSGLQRDWELLSKYIDELKTRQTAQETSLKAIATTLDAMRQEGQKERDESLKMISQMAEQMRTIDEVSRHMRTALPQALQALEKQIDTRLREQAQLTQAELAAMQRRMEAGVADSFVKRMETLRFVAK